MTSKSIQDQIIDYTVKQEFPPFTMNKKGNIIEYEGRRLNLFNTLLKKKLI